MLSTIPELKQAYIDTGKVRYVFKNFPLAGHANAQAAAEAAMCAGAQNAFWAMHDLLFGKQAEWSRLPSPIDVFAGYAAGLKLDTAAFRACVESRQFAADIARDVQEGRAAGITGTPSFLINGQVMIGAYPFAEFQRRIEAELAKLK